MTADEQAVLEGLFGEGVTERNEGGRRLILLPIVTLPAGCRPETTFGIYVASEHSGYETRLFLETPITRADGRSPAVTTDVICGRTMYAASWRGVSASLPLHEGILAHLRLYDTVTT